MKIKKCGAEKPPKFVAREGRNNNPPNAIRERNGDKKKLRRKGKESASGKRGQVNRKHSSGGNHMPDIVKKYGEV